MVTKRKLIMSTEDHDQLNILLCSRLALAFADRVHLQSLRDELNIATLVPSEDVPPDVVTMNSTVRIRDVHSKEIDTYTLVYPQDADIAEGKLSILAPIGTAILGYRVGDLVRWQVPSGQVRFRIEELVFQPERDRVTS